MFLVNIFPRKKAFFAEISLWSVLRLIPLELKKIPVLYIFNSLYNTCCNYLFIFHIFGSLQVLVSLCSLILCLLAVSRAPWIYCLPRAPLLPYITVGFTFVLSYILLDFAWFRLYCPSITVLPLSSIYTSLSSFFQGLCVLMYVVSTHFSKWHCLSIMLLFSILQSSIASLFVFLDLTEFIKY